MCIPPLKRNHEKISLTIPDDKINIICDDDYHENNLEKLDETLYCKYCYHWYNWYYDASVNNK